MEVLVNVHKHSKVTVKQLEDWDPGWERWVAVCGACGEESDDCDTAAIAKRNLALTNYGGFRP